MRQTKFSFLALILILATVGKTHAQSIKWMSWTEAIALNESAKKQGRPTKQVFVEVYTEWCQFCKLMEQNAFRNVELIHYLNQNYLCVRLDAQERSNISYQGISFKYVSSADGTDGVHQLAYSLLEGDLRYPTFLFFDPDMILLQRIPGAMDSKELLKVLSFFNSQNYEKVPFTEFRAKSSQPQSPVPPAQIKCNKPARNGFMPVKN